jgi:hypothetical protein
MPQHDPGEELVSTIVAGLPEGCELDEREHAILAAAASQARDISRLEADLAERGTRVPGSREGHEVLNPALAELRQARLALGKLLGALELPDSASDAARRTARASQRRQRAAA